MEVQLNKLREIQNYFYEKVQKYYAPIYVTIYYAPINRYYEYLNKIQKAREIEKQREKCTNNWRDREENLYKIDVFIM